MPVKLRTSTLLLLGSVFSSCGQPDDDVSRETSALQAASGLADTAALARSGAVPGDIVTVGHGVAVDSQGRAFEPNLSDVVAWQKAQLASLESGASVTALKLLQETKAAQATLAIQRAAAPAAASQKTEIDGNATLISILLADRNTTSSAGLTQINAFLANKLGAGTFAASKASTTTAPATLSGLVGAFRTTTTTSSGQAYIDQCNAAGVPTPPAWGSSLWVEQRNGAGSNILSPDFLTPGRTIVFTYTSSAPRGLCIALPRLTSAGSGVADLLGIICQGNDTSKSCFWDSRAGTNIPLRPNPPLPIVGGNIVGGFELASNGQGMCSDCHAGENTFIVHPGSQLANPGSNLKAKEFVQPIVASSWLQNKRPGRDLDIVAVPSGQQSCISCHSRNGTGGRFPRFRSHTGYCATVMGNALTATMPPGAPNSAAYQAHRDAIRNNICNKPFTVPNRFAATPTTGHGFFSLNGEIPMLGDFNNDGRMDIITFTLGSAADAYVSLSNGTSFGTSSIWHAFFGLNGEIPLVGDFNGDGRDDIVTMVVNSSHQAVVALSNGSSFGTSVNWGGHTLPGEVPLIGDFNYDGRDDIVTLTKGSTNQALVNLSTGSSFGPSVLWASSISPGSEIPLVGDFDGDGFQDIASFTRGSTADVFVFASTGSGFRSGVKWHDAFAFGAEIPKVGDINGDGLDDILTFTRGSTGDVYVALSDGTKFVGTALKWHELFGLNQELPFAGDMNADGFADLVLFKQGSTADVMIAKAVP